MLFPLPGAFHRHHPHDPEVTALASPLYPSSLFLLPLPSPTPDFLPSLSLTTFQGITDSLATCFGQCTDALMYSLAFY